MDIEKTIEENKIENGEIVKCSLNHDIHHQSINIYQHPTQAMHSPKPQVFSLIVHKYGLKGMVKTEIYKQSIDAIMDEVRRVSNTIRESPYRFAYPTNHPLPFLKMENHSKKMKFRLYSVNLLVNASVLFL